MLRKVVLFVLVQIFAGMAFSQELTTVILVRHAEKVSEDDDAGLSEKGSARAQLLTKMLQSSQISAIYSSPFRRTKLTVQPLAEKLGLQVQVMDAHASKQLAATILTKNSGKTVVVCGHSNTLPEIVEALGAGKAPEIDLEDYDNLWIVNVSATGKAKLVKLKYFIGS